MKHTKRTMLLSVLGIFLCLSMLAGTTFAWFTDTASTTVSRIQSGTLDVALEYQDGETWKNAEGEELHWVRNCTNGEMLWEPGCTYSLPKIRVRNNGELALKFVVDICGITGDAKLLEVIDWTFEGFEGDVYNSDAEHPLEPGQSMELTIHGHMRETAGNEYQGLSIEGIGITVLATQYTWECDSYNNTYDENAAYRVEDTVTMKAALNLINNSITDNEATIHVTKDFAYEEQPLTVTNGKSVTIDLMGHNLTISNERNDGIVVTGGATLRLTNSGTEGKYIFNTTSRINDAIYVYNTDPNTVSTLNMDHVETDIDATQWMSIHPYATAGKSVINLNEGTILNINGATDIAGIYADSNSEVNINEGAVFNVNGTGGSANLNAVGVCVGLCNGGTGNGVVNMTGGTMNLTGTSFLCGIQTGSSAASIVNMSGGTMNVQGQTEAMGLGIYQGGSITMSGGTINVANTAGNGYGATIGVPSDSTSITIGEAAVINVDTTAGGTNVAWSGTHITDNRPTPTP